MAFSWTELKTLEHLPNFKYMSEERKEEEY